jgi:preprotein translocase subunit SecE
MADKKNNATQQEVAEPKARENRSAKAVAREREERRARESKVTRRDSKQTSYWTRLRGNRLVNFLFEAYRELRYKVTWPTFEEARNMTIAVIILSGVVAAVLALADLGLLKLFRLISGQ